jgi:putative ABC transport system permease protein
VVAFRQAQVQIDGSTAFVTGTDPATASSVLDTSTTAGAFTDLAQPDTVSVSKRVADDQQLAVGDTLSMTFAETGAQKLEVVAIHDESTLLGDYVVSLDTYDANVAQVFDQIVFVTFADGVSAEQGQAAATKALADYPNVEAKDQQATKDAQSKAIDQVLSFVIVLLLLSIVIAVFGIVNTLGLSIYERVRELGLVRAVGMSRVQVKRMVRVEAVIIAVLGAILGLVIGLVFGVALQRALAPLGIDRLAIPVGQLAIFLIAAAVCGVLAAVFPARRAAKLNVLEAIAYE